ncbi:MAG TPA: glycosyltransferase [Candidatus Saccharimonadia bacterium]
MSPTQPELGLACIVPVYNEAAVLTEAITMLVTNLRQTLPYEHWQVVIASNGCTDDTDELARKLEQTLHPHVRLVVCSQKGRGKALREVFGEVPAQRYLYIDVDLPCELDDLARVLRPLDDGYDLVTSHRTGYRPPLRRTMTLSLRLLNRGLFGVRVSDSQCAVKALSPKAAKVLVEDCQQTGWYLDTELVVLGQVRGLRWTEVPIHWVERRFPQRTSKVDVWDDSWKALRSLRQIWRRRRALARTLAASPSSQ